MKLLRREELYEDNIGFVELWDNSLANESLENRVNVVTQVASVCFGKENSKKPEKLYERLINESMGLPSSSFEFVPVLLGALEIKYLQELSSAYFGKKDKVYQPHCLKFGELLNIKDKVYVLTNLRALLYDNKISKEIFDKDIGYWLNKGKDLEVIYNNYHLFRVKVPILVARQIMRHRVNLQELSRRYTKGDLEFFNFKDKKLNWSWAINDYNNLLEEGWKAEEARIVLPVATYTTIWIGFTKNYLDNFLELRTDKHTQEPTRELAEKMKELLEIKLYGEIFN